MEELNYSDGGAWWWNLCARVLAEASQSLPQWSPLVAEWRESIKRQHSIHTRQSPKGIRGLVSRS